MTQTSESQETWYNSALISELRLHDKIRYLKNKFSINWVQIGKVHSNLMIDVKEMPIVQEVERELKMEIAMLGFITRAWGNQSHFKWSVLKSGSPTRPIFVTTLRPRSGVKGLVASRVHCLLPLSSPDLDLFSAPISQFLVGLWVMKELQSLPWAGMWHNLRPQENTQGKTEGDDDISLGHRYLHRYLSPAELPVSQAYRLRPLRGL